MPLRLCSGHTLRENHTTQTQVPVYQPVVGNHGAGREQSFIQQSWATTHTSAKRRIYLEHILQDTVSFGGVPARAWALDMFERVEVPATPVISYLTQKKLSASHGESTIGLSFGHQLTNGLTQTR